jgi:hypothetical protein
MQELDENTVVQSPPKANADVDLASFISRRNLSLDKRAKAGCYCPLEPKAGFDEAVSNPLPLLGYAMAHDQPGEYHPARVVLRLAISPQSATSSKVLRRSAHESHSIPLQMAALYLQFHASVVTNDEEKEQVLASPLSFRQPEDIFPLNVFQVERAEVLTRLC